MKRKLCGKCQRKRDIKNFTIRNKEKGWLTSWCKDCVKSYDRKRYTSDTDNIRKRLKSNRISTRKRNRHNIWEYFKSYPCTDCGEEDPIVLTFDHLYNKEFAIADKIDSYSWERILKEIEKCEVRCANCHLRKTAIQMNWYEE